MILLDPEGRVLLFRVDGTLLPVSLPVDTPPVPRPPSPKATDATFWITPGGGLEPGESYGEGVRRELWEETGITDAKFGPVVWLREHAFFWEGAWYRNRERFYIGWANGSGVARDNQTEEELRVLLEHRWWSIEEMAASDQRFVPLDFATLLEPLIAGHLPDTPLQVGL